jgi:hypothetical protein
MRTKFNLSIYQENHLISSKDYKTMKEMALDHPDVGYMILRQIYLYHTKKQTPKFIHAGTKSLIERYRITDIVPGVKSNQTTNEQVEEHLINLTY